MRKKRSEKRRQQQAQESNSSEDFVLPPDRRGIEKTLSDIGRLMKEQEFSSIDEMNAFLEKLMTSGGPPPTTAHTPLEEAQDIMYQAWDARSRRQRVQLARKALSVSEDCADAYVLLAEETAKTVEEAQRLYAQGVAAGERALGPEVFEEDSGHFWGILETRPYMRARQGLAQCLWAMGRKEEAITHFRDMLRLNPNDNQGVRYLLVTLLLEVEDDDALKQLLDEYKDDGTAVWLYSRALWQFRRDGASRAATNLLKKAIKHNPSVPLYLLGRKRLPRQLPLYMGFGDESEAVHYAAEAMDIWQRNKAALAWLREVFGGDDAGPRKQR